jgi:hypothetical protein
VAGRYDLGGGGGYRVGVGDSVSAEKEGEDLVQSPWVLGQDLVEAYIQLDEGEGHQAMAGKGNLYLHQTCIQGDYGMTGILENSYRECLAIGDG